FRSYGNENWESDERGLMRRRIASINDLPIQRLEKVDRARDVDGYQQTEPYRPRHWH
ncbi:MAG: DUF1348 family protein, partial [Proteobacteria bacterium]|nr:DUF1348 family protein [Pseudomonadota bacterium]